MDMQMAAGISIPVSGGPFSKVKGAKSFCTTILDQAKQVLIQYGNHSPMLFLFCEEAVHVITIPFDSVEFPMIVKALIGKFNAKGIGLVSEAWTVISENGESALDGPRPSEHPNRREILMVRAEWKSGRSRHAAHITQMIRDADGKLTGLLDDDKTNEAVSNGQVAGRLVGFFDEEKD